MDGEALSYASEVLADSPLAYWRLGEALGTTMVDASGNARNGSYVGSPTLGAAGLVVGDTDTAITLNGSSQYGQVTHAAWMDVTSLTLEAIIKTTVANNLLIIDHDNSAAANRGWQFRVGTSGKLEFVRINNAAGATVVVVATGATVVSDGNRHHVALTYDGTTAKLYADGALDSTTTISGGLWAANAKVGIGVNFSFDAGTAFWNGTLDEAAYFGTVLSATRIKAHSDASKGLGPVTVTGSPWTAPATWLDGATKVGIRLDGAAWTAPATWLDGTIPVFTPANLAGDAWAAPATWRDGTPSGVTVTGTGWTSPASWLDGAITGQPVVIDGAPWTVPATWLDGPTLSDLTFGNLGYDYTGVSDVTYEPPASPVPAGMTLAPVHRVHNSLPAPTLVDGRPSGWVQTETIGPDWADYLRVKIGGKDVTFFRGFLTIPTDWSRTDPYGWSTATVVIPGVTHFEDPASAELAWLYEGAKIRLDPVLDGAVVDPYDPPFFGIVDRIDRGENATVLECSGNFTGRMSSLMHQPPIMDRGARDGGEWISREMDHSPHYALAPHGGPTTGIALAHHGDRTMTRLGFLDDTLGLLIKAGGGSWTILPDRSGLGPRYMRCVERDMSGPVDFTVHAGAHGVKVSLPSDRLDKKTAIFGDGVAPNHERWRNAVYPRLVPGPVPTFPGTMSLGTTDADTTTGSGVSVLCRRLWALNKLRADDITAHVFTDEVEDAVKDFQDDLNLSQTGVVNEALWRKLFDADFSKKSYMQAHFEPLASDPRTRYYLRGPNGQPVDLNPRYDRDVTPHEEYVGYGNNVTKRQAKKNARAQIDRAGALVGTVTLTTDPAEMSRFDIREGMTGQLAHYHGTGLKVWVSSVQVDWADERQPVTLAVSTSAKHYLELATIIQRRKDAARDVGKQAKHQFRRSTISADSSGGWEGESGAGIVEETALRGGHWNVLQIVAAQFGSISDIHLTTDAPTPFWFMVCATAVSEDVFDRVLGDPSTWRGTGDNKVNTFVDHFDWLRQPERLMIESWGDPDNMPGYAPHHHTNAAGKVTTHPVTGRFWDLGQWDFISASGFLWLPVWVPNDCTIKGRFKVLPSGEGV